MTEISPWIESSGETKEFEHLDEMDSCSDYIFEAIGDFPEVEMSIWIRVQISR